MSLTSRFFGARDGHPDPEDVSLSLDVDDALAILKNERRRLVLEEVATRDDECVDIRTLARIVAAGEKGCAESEVRTKEKKAAYVGLYQAHLPKLDKAGLISFDSDRSVVYKTAETSAAVEFVDVAASMLEERE